MRALALPLALLLALPVALANTPTWWIPGAGPAEPSTVYDVPDGMWMDPNTDPFLDKIYLSGFLYAHRSGEAAGLPHVGVDPGVPVAAAHLGRWRDCDHDSIVDLQAYPAVDLLATQTCPVLGPNHDGTWVTEWHPVPMASVSFVDLGTGTSQALAWDATLQHWVGSPFLPSGGLLMWEADVPNTQPWELPLHGLRDVD